MTAGRTFVAFLAAGLAAAVAAACGHDDDNLAAARVVANGYLEARHDKDARAACRVLGPGQAQMFAARGAGSCDAGIATTFGGSEPFLRAGAARRLDDDLIQVAVSGHPDEPLTLLHLASTWHVVGGWGVH